MTVNGSTGTRMNNRSPARFHAGYAELTFLADHRLGGGTACSDSSPSRGSQRLHLHPLDHLLREIEPFNDTAGIYRLPDDPHRGYPDLRVNGKRKYKIDQRVMEDIQ